MALTPLTVNEGHLGTREAEWLAPRLLHDLPPLRWVPPAHALVVAPHPDDEVLGVGGLIRRMAAAGASIEILSVTDGEGSHPDSARVTRAELADRRNRERDLALARLGVGRPRLVRARLPDGRVGDWTDRLGRLIALRLRVAMAARPDRDVVCLAPWHRDGHPDHDAAGVAAAAACEATGAVLAAYLVWTWHWATPASHQVPWPRARRVDLGRPDVAHKRWAMTAFASQIRPVGPDPGDAAVLPHQVLARFRRPFEVVLS